MTPPDELARLASRCGHTIATGPKDRPVFRECGAPCPTPLDPEPPRCEKHTAEAFARRADAASKQARARNEILKRQPDILRWLPRGDLQRDLERLAVDAGLMSGREAAERAKDHRAMADLKRHVEGR